MCAYVILQPVRKKQKLQRSPLLPFNTTSPERLQWPFCSTMVVQVVVSIMFIFPALGEDSHLD